MIPHGGVVPLLMTFTHSLVRKTVKGVAYVANNSNVGNTYMWGLRTQFPHNTGYEFCDTGA